MALRSRFEKPQRSNLLNRFFRRIGDARIHRQVSEPVLSVSQCGLQYLVSFPA